MKVSTEFVHTVIEVKYMVEEKRIKKGLTQSELGRRIGKSAGYVSKLENRKFTNVTIKIILKLAYELDIDKVELFLFFSNPEELKMKDYVRHMRK